MDIIKKLTDLENEASAFGFKWETAEQIIAQIRSEIIEIEVHLKDKDQAKLQEEIGDLMHAVFSLCVFCQFDANETLKNSVSKFAHRFKKTKIIAEKAGFKDLNGQSFDILMKIWNKAKTINH